MSLAAIIDKMIKLPEVKNATDPEVVDFVAQTMAHAFGGTKDEYKLKALEILVAYAAIKMVETGVLK